MSTTDGGGVGLLVVDQGREIHEGVVRFNPGLIFVVNERNILGVMGEDGIGAQYLK